MFHIVDGFFSAGNPWWNIFLLLLAFFRVYLEVIKFDFLSLPMTKALFRGQREEAQKFHRYGLFLSLGYIVLSAPFTLFS